MLVLAAEEAVSKTPFYIAAGVLVGWALILAVVGLRSQSFPGSDAGSRAVMGLSVLLALGTMLAAVISS